MFGIQNYNGFLLAVILFQLYPGPGTIAILNATARGGVGKGMKAVFGTLTGDFIYMLSAVLGLAAILSANPGILNVAQWIGIAYLFWIGIKYFRVSANKIDPAEKEVKDWACYREALAICLTNPKAIIFFMAFFPLFLTDDSKPSTLTILMAHVTVISFLYQSMLVLLGNATIRKISKFRSAPVITTRLAGVAIMAFGIKLLLNKR